MREAVKERAGEPLGAEHGRPLVEREIARDQRAAALVPLAEHLEQQLGPGRRERHIAEFVDDQQLVAGELTLKAQQTFFIARFVQLVDQGGRSGEADRETLLAGGQTEPEGHVVLPVPLLPTAMMFSRRATYSERASSSTRVLLSEGRAVKSKLSRLFTAGNLASLIRRSMVRRSRSIISSSVRRSR